LAKVLNVIEKGVVDAQVANPLEGLFQHFLGGMPSLSGVLAATVCSGECCRRFSVAGMTLAQLQEATGFQDVAKIASMVIPLKNIEGETSPMFTCRHWNVETKRCMDYENRPRMCRTFPNGKACPACGGG
jgi:Putative zinc- or iron-chelating domain